MLSIVACLPHAGAVETQKPRNTHATIEERMFSARWWVTHATAGSLLSAPRQLLCNDSVNTFNNIGGVFCVVGGEFMHV
jgi:hypothetical protein